MKILYVAKAVFNKESNTDTMGWEKYIQWSRLSQLSELVSLDGMLNETLVEPNRENEKEWDYIEVEYGYETGFFTSLDYVMEKMKGKDRFNLLALVKDPEADCKSLEIENFEFMGYDLIEMFSGISSLTNCGGFDETFLPQELSQFGLISDYGRVIEIRENLLLNNPGEPHADTSAIAIWRHKYVGRI